MADTQIVLAFWAGLLALSVPYVLYAKHPAQKPVAAIAIFVLVFSVAAFLLFRVASLLLQLAEVGDVLTEPWAAVLFLIVVFVPAILLARWQIRKPPRGSPPLK